MKSPARECRGCGGPLGGRLRDQYCSKVCEVGSKRTSPEPDPIPGTKWIHLTKGKFALVDVEDYERANIHPWYLHEGRSTYYARSWIPSEDGRKSLRLHHLVLNIKSGSGILVDHCNHDGLDCRKENLFPVDESGNRLNTLQKGGKTPYKGVTPVKNNRFKAAVRHNRRQYYLGYHATMEKAAIVYDRKARELGGFTRFNFPIPWSGELSAFTLDFDPKKPIRIESSDHNESKWTVEGEFVNSSDPEFRELIESLWNNNRSIQCFDPNRNIRVLYWPNNYLDLMIQH